MPHGLHAHPHCRPKAPLPALLPVVVVVPPPVVPLPVVQVVPPLPGHLVGVPAVGCWACPRNVKAACPMCAEKLL